jgi:hypothetical protein
MPPSYSFLNCLAEIGILRPLLAHRARNFRPRRAGVPTTELMRAARLARSCEFCPSFSVPRGCFNVESAARIATTAGVERLARSRAFCPFSPCHEGVSVFDSARRSEKYAQPILCHRAPRLRLHKFDSRVYIWGEAGLFSCLLHGAGKHKFHFIRYSLSKDQGMRKLQVRLDIFTTIP